MKIEEYGFGWIAYYSESVFGWGYTKAQAIEMLHDEMDNRA